MIYIELIPYLDILQEKAKELQRKRYEEMKRGGSGNKGGYGGYGSSSGGSGGFQAAPVTDTISQHVPQVTCQKLALSSIQIMCHW